MIIKYILKKCLPLFCYIYCGLSFANQASWYITFSGESSKPINNIYVLSLKGSVLGSVIADPDALGISELRTMAIGPDNQLYLVNAHKTDSRILEFDVINKDGITRKFINDVITPATTAGLRHPDQIAFGPDGNIYLGVQDTNVVMRFYGPLKPLKYNIIGLSSFLIQKYPNGIFVPGTFIAPFTAREPAKYTHVPQNLGGLTAQGRSSVRGLAFLPNDRLYVADEGNNRIGVYDVDTGELKATISSKIMIRPDQLFYYQQNGLLYIACPGSNRILTYNPNTKELKTFIHDSNHLSMVTGIAFGEDGNFYAADRANKEIVYYNKAGKYLGVFAGPFTDAPEGLLPIYS